jgi:hypothetical protein
LAQLLGAAPRGCRVCTSRRGSDLAEPDPDLFCWLAARGSCASDGGCRELAPPYAADLAAVAWREREAVATAPCSGRRSNGGPTVACASLYATRRGAST